jgi:hypothetical protein
MLEPGGVCSGPSTIGPFWARQKDAAPNPVITTAIKKFFKDGPSNLKETKPPLRHEYVVLY